MGVLWHFWFLNSIIASRARIWLTSFLMVSKVAYFIQLNNCEETKKFDLLYSKICYFKVRDLFWLTFAFDLPHSMFWMTHIIKCWCTMIKQKLLNCYERVNFECRWQNLTYFQLYRCQILTYLFSYWTIHILQNLQICNF